jgi:hypothetical protein
MTPRQPKAVTRRNRRSVAERQPTTTTTTGREALPEALRDLRGADKFKVTTRRTPRSETVDVRPRSGGKKREKDRYELHLIMTTDFTELDEVGEDPLISAHTVARSIRELQEYLEALVRFARTKGHSWTLIGEALGMTRQAAWDKYSGED